MCVDRHDLGLLLLRLGTGGVLAAHGAQKLFGWFGGPGVQATAGMMESMGYRPGKASALTAGLTEGCGGALLALGLATPAAGAGVAGGMAGAAAVHAPNGFFAQDGGLELPATVGMVATGIAVMGPGRLSLDHVLGHTFNRDWMVPTALAVASAAAVAVVGCRQRRIREASSGGNGDANGNGGGAEGAEAPGDE